MIKLETNRRSIMKRGVQMNDKFKNDKLKFELIRNADLVCTDCLYKYDDTNMPCNVSKCEMYEEKPSTVIDGGNCDLYDKGAVSYTHLDVYKRQATQAMPMPEASMVSILLTGAPANRCFHSAPMALNRATSI